MPNTLTYAMRSVKQTINLIDYCDTFSMKIISNSGSLEVLSLYYIVIEGEGEDDDDVISDAKFFVF